MATNILDITRQYNTEAKCLSLLIKLRWGKTVKCPYCESKKIRTLKTHKGRYVCKNCKEQFSVLTDTIFEEKRLPLTKVFASIALILNAKSGIAAKEVQRNIGLTYKTAYYLCMRIRVGMLMKDTKMNGIIEMDESYFGGKARRRRKVKDNTPSLSTNALKRGRGTNRVSVAAMVKRKGNVKTQVMEKLTKRNLLAMLKHYASKENSILVTDGFKSYKELEKYIERLEINHSKEYSRGIIHVNTVEGFWSYVKNGIKGSYKAISKKYLPFYLIEYEWKYNHKTFRGNEFETYLKNALNQPKEMLHWKAKSTEKVKEIAYGK